MLLFLMNVLLECLMFIKLILAKVTTQKQEDKLWTMGEECLFSLHTHYLSFITQWKHDFFSPMSLILFAPGNNASFYSVPLTTNGRAVPYNGKIALLQKNINKIKIRKTSAQLLAMPHFLTSLTTSSQHLECGEQSRPSPATTGWWLLLLTGRLSSSTVFPLLQMKTTQCPVWDSS